MNKLIKVADDISIEDIKNKAKDVRQRLVKGINRCDCVRDDCVCFGIYCVKCGKRQRR